MTQRLPASVPADRPLPGLPAAPIGTVAPNPPSGRPPPTTASAKPGPDLSLLGAALRAADCGAGATLSARDRQRCLEQAAAGGAREPSPPPTTAQRHAREALDDARYKANRRLGELVRDPKYARCAGSDLCHADLPIVIPFGKVPKALPVIPPSTLRGDDDALRPKPRPPTPGG